MSLPRLAAAVGRRRRLLAMILLVPLSSRTAQAGTDWSVQDLFATLARPSSSRARFIEFRRISELDGLLESSGELEFEAPDHLVKRTLRPQREELMLQGDQLSLRQGRFEQQMPMADLPGIGELALGLRALLLGDLAGLQAAFMLTLTGGRADWRLTATPRQRQAAAVLTGLIIRGQGPQIDEIHIDLANGDASTIRILPP